MAKEEKCTTANVWVSISAIQADNFKYLKSLLSIYFLLTQWKRIGWKLQKKNYLKVWRHFGICWISFSWIFHSAEIYFLVLAFSIYFETAAFQREISGLIILESVHAFKFMSADFRFIRAKLHRYWKFYEFVLSFLLKNCFKMLHHIFHGVYKWWTLFISKYEKY